MKAKLLTGFILFSTIVIVTLPVLSEAGLYSYLKNLMAPKGQKKQHVSFLQETQNKRSK